MSKLTDLAKGKPCMIRLPGVCRGGGDTTVPCHLPLMDYHGVALKTQDVFVAWGCHHCHDAVDRRRFGDVVSRTVAREAHYDGMYRTLAYIMEYHMDVLTNYLESQ